MSRRANLALLLLGMLTLHLEMLLIRWVSTELPIFAYLQNAILVACVLGLGIGCLTSCRENSARRALVPFLTLAMGLSVPAIREILRQTTHQFSLLHDYPVWSPSAESGARSIRIAAACGCTLALLTVVAAVFVPLGRLLGRLLGESRRPIHAYSLNIAGSLLGIGLFAALSAAWQPPWVWCAAAGVLAAPFLWRNWLDPLLVLALVAIVGYCQSREAAEETIWSPYQKLTVHCANDDGYPWRLVTANEANYFWIYDLRPETIRRFPERFGNAESAAGWYDLPYRNAWHLGRVLVVGSGAGNDVAAALRAGASHVTAVEIDPAIIEIGRRHHPERPYDDPRVEVVRDDARAWFARSTGPYDRIVFGLLDAHTTIGGLNARLDHFVYTRESFAQVRRLLADDGLVVVGFETVNEVQTARLHHLLAQSFPHCSTPVRIPQSVFGPGGVVFIAGNTPAVIDLPDAQPIDPLPTNIEVPTDDWPYLYLREPGIPTPFTLLAVLVLAVFLISRAWLNLPSRGPAPRSRCHFFLLGVGFMLQETAGIARGAVIFGNTWEVSAGIVAAVLFFILLANAAAGLWPGMPDALVWTGLFLSCGLLYAVDLSALHAWGTVERITVAAATLCLPVFFASLAFIRSLVLVEARDAAIGVNLFGSLVGGLLQALTFALGFRALVIVVLAAYLAAWGTSPARSRR